MESSLGQLDQQDFATIHDFSEIELVLTRYEYVLHHIDREELPDLVEDWHDCLTVELLRPSSELIGPKIPHDIILNILDHHISKVLVREGSYHIEYSRLGDIEESEKEHTEYMFELGIPICSEEFFEYIDKSFCEYLLGFSLFYSERIETKWKLFIGRIEYDNILLARGRNMHHHFVDEIPMRIHDRYSLAIYHIIDHLTDEEFGFADSCLADHVHMTQTILIIYPYGYSYTTIVRLCEYGQ